MTSYGYQRGESFDIPRMIKQFLTDNGIGSDDRSDDRADDRGDERLDDRRDDRREDHRGHRGPGRRSSGGPGGGPGGGPFGPGGPFGAGGPFGPGGPFGRGGPFGKGGQGGQGGWGAPPWGGPRRHRGPRAGRGDVRSALLALLSEQPMHGYQMIQEIGARSGGAWKPSPGSVYPTLQQLEDEGLVRAEDLDGRRVFRLTADGEALAAERSQEFADLWRAMTPEKSSDDLGALMFGVGTAFFHVITTGSTDQQDEARKVLARTRAELYRILGDNSVGEDSPGADDDESATVTEVDFGQDDTQQSDIQHHDSDEHGKDDRA